MTLLNKIKTTLNTGIQSLSKENMILQTEIQSLVKKCKPHINVKSIKLSRLQTVQINYLDTKSKCC